MRWSLLALALGSLFAAPLHGQEQPACVMPSPQVQDRWYVDGEFLWWYLRQERVPPLLTTGPAASQGVIGQPGTQILLGEEKIKSRHDRFIGLRAALGWWFDEERTWAVELRAIILERDSTNFTIKPTSQFLARPYIDANTGQWASEIISGRLPNGDELLGSFNTYSRIEFFGQEANAVSRLFENENLRLEGVLGGRFLQMRHRLDITSSGQLQPDLAVLYGVRDHFQTFNKFFGGQAGLRGELNWGVLFLRLGGSVALGGTDEEIRTKATRLVHTPNFREEQLLGLYVMPSNSGRYSRIVFDAVTEAQMTVGCQLTDHIKFTVGYTFLHWLNPIRSGGDQIDAIHPQQIVGGPISGPARPYMPFNDDFFWAQGASVGLEITW